MSRALRAAEARSCLETRTPADPSCALAQLCMQVMICTCRELGSDASVWPGQADSGASRKSHGPEAWALPGNANSAHAIPDKKIFRILLLAPPAVQAAQLAHGQT